MASRYWHQICKGRVGSNVLMVALACSFHVLIALSAAFWRCMDGDTSWNDIFLSFILFFNSVDASLSSLVTLGMNPIDEKCS